mgnify:CR=1 FL=1
MDASTDTTTRVLTMTRTFDAPRAMSQAAEAALQTAREGGGDRVIRGK